MIPTANRPWHISRNERMDPSIIDRFQLGYARNTWDGLRNYLQNKRVPVNLIEKSGLVIPRKSGTGYYDRFRERIVFPIYNLNKQVVGFGGRVLDASLPKYLNSPETPVYSKSKLLYGLHLARNKCRETRTVYIVEGYFDLLALHQYGVENAGATLGTALTTEHIHMIKGFAEKVILVFDADDAGIQASLRSVGIFIEKGMQARVMLLPKGHDPDSFMRKYGLEAFNEMAAKSRSVITFHHGIGPEKIWAFGGWENANYRRAENAPGLYSRSPEHEMAISKKYGNVLV